MGWGKDGPDGAGRGPLPLVYAHHCGVFFVRSGDESLVLCLRLLFQSPVFSLDVFEVVSPFYMLMLLSPSRSFFI